MDEQRQRHILWAGLALFGIMQMMLVWNGGAHGVFNSPDASTNYHFALRIYEGQSLPMPLDAERSEARQFLFTRSTKIVGDTLLPVGFLGLVVLYGLISSVLFVNLIPYLTVVAALMGVYFFYRLIEHFFDASVALSAGILVLLHPAWWYYTNESLMPNVLFLSLTMTGLALIFSEVYARRPLRSVLAALCIGFALWVRLSEALWLLPLILGWQLAGVSRHESVRDRAYFWGALLTVCAFLWFAQALLTNSTTLFGYVAPVAAVSGNAGGIVSLLMPFGFHPRLIALHAFQYGLLLFWPYTLAALVSLWLSGVTMLKHERSLRVYFIGTVLSGVCVMVFYGSWTIADSPDPTQMTIGNSFVRYFLPWYVLTVIPICAAGLMKALGYLSVRSRRIVALLLTLGAAFFMVSVALTGGPETILAKQETLRGYDSIAGWVQQHTPEDSVILTAKGDKYLWPHRSVITSFADENGLAAAAHYRRVELRKLYYSGVTLDETKRDAFARRLEAVGLELRDPVYTFRDVSLYPIEEVNSNETL